VLQLEVLVVEGAAVDGLSACAIVIRKVAALNSSVHSMLSVMMVVSLHLQHESGDDSMEGASLVAEALLTGAE